MSYSAPHTFGTLSSAPSGGAVRHIFAHVREVLKDFKTSLTDNENALTDKLCKALEFKKPAEFPYFFHHQNIENERENTSTDFAAFGTYAYAETVGLEDLDTAPPLIKFEAKRLSAQLPRKREREYVTGEYEERVQTKNSGGIERFKNERHGKDVSWAGMIGYLQTGTAAEWLTRINSWINDEINSPQDPRLIWSVADQLSADQTSSNTWEYISRSTRLSGTQITLRHFWVGTTDG